MISESIVEMKFRFPLIFRILLLTTLIGPLVAEEVSLDRLLKDMASPEFATRKQAHTRLIAQALETPEASVKSLHKVWKSEQDIELKIRLKAVLEILYQRIELGIGAPSIDARIGWFLYHDGKYLSTFPQIVEIDKDGAAAKAGLLPGDVLLKINGVGLWDDHSVIRLENCLKSLKPGQVAKLDIRRSGNGSTEPFEKYFRYKRKTLEVVTVANDKASAEVSKEKFGKWLKALSETPAKEE